jgi:hypothetical protein
VEILIAFAAFSAVIVFGIIVHNADERRKRYEMDEAEAAQSIRD